MKKERFILILAVVYFFFNSFMLPEGLLYTTFLTPFFYVYLIGAGYKNVVGYFMAVLIPLFIAHYLVGIDLFFYIKSSVLYLTIYLFVFAFAVSLRNGLPLEKLYGKLLLINFALFIVALVFYFTPWSDLFWYDKKLTQEIAQVNRLKMLTYEPSYYSTLLVPIVLYYALGVMTKRYKPKQIFGIIVLVGIPLLFSFSLGVLSSLTFALIVTVLFFFKKFMKHRTSFYMFSFLTASVLVLFLLLTVFYPDNLLYLRIEDLFEGKDTSGRGRTIEAWDLSFQMIELKNYWIGCGLGQIKVVGEEVVRVFYKYQLDDIPIIRIPAAVGETISTFGIIGLLVRLILEFYLFFKTKVYTNFYRFSLFSYMFLYQFTGSFLTNIAEYVIWVIAFTPGFFDFNFQKQKPASKSV
jgi:hypothetical protein